MSVGDSPGFGCDPDPDAGKICDCLGCSLSSIADSTAEIARILDEKLGGVCDNVDECIDEIIEGINKRFTGGLASCEACQNMLLQGLGGTLEYAIRCASVTCDECDTVCSAGLMNDGECCKLPDGSEGICVDGVCVPRGVKEEEEEEKFVGWCNPTNKIVVVTKGNEPSPGPGFQKAALAETEIVAFQEAKSFCDSIIDRPEPSDQKPASFGAASLPFCNLSSLVDGNTLNIAAAAQTSFFREGGALQVIDSFADIGALGVTLSDVGSVIWGAARMLTGREAFYATHAAANFPPLVGCDNQTFQEAMKLLISVQLYQSQSGTNIEEFLLPYKYAMHAACRQIHLGRDESMRSYLANGISRTELENLWAIHGMCPEDVEWRLQADRSKPVPLQLAIMRHREIINPDTYHSRMREMGYTDPVAREQLFDITRQVPTLSDIIRYMVRDTDDTAIVAKFGLDSEFNNKYGAQLKRWAQDQGIPDEVALHSWRAHWKIPSPGQLFTFWHRLRKNPAFGTEAEQLQQIKDALTQQDILPFWQDEFLAVSFRPMRLRDIRRSFQVGTLTEAEAREQFQFLGYSDPTVDLMIDFLKRLRDRAVRNDVGVKQWASFEKSRTATVADLRADGIPQVAIDKALLSVEPNFAKSVAARAYIRGDMTKVSFESLLRTAGVSASGTVQIIRVTGLQRRDHESLKDYEVGTRTDTDAINDMVNDGIPTEVASSLIQAASGDIGRDFVKRCVAGIKRRFLLGELDDADATNELVGRGITNVRATQSVDWWGCELKASEKDVSANTLCEWLGRGAITPTSFLNRLDKIGFSTDDAALMLDDCLIKMDARRLKQAKREMADQAREQARITRVLDRANRDEATAVRKLASARKTRARNRIMRIKQMHRIVDKLTDKTGADTGDAYILAESERKRIESANSLTIDLALQALLLATEEFAGETLSEYPAIVSIVAARVAASDIPGTEPQLSAPNGNGEA